MVTAVMQITSQCLRSSGLLPGCMSYSPVSGIAVSEPSVSETCASVPRIYLRGLSVQYAVRGGTTEITIPPAAQVKLAPILPALKAE